MYPGIRSKRWRSAALLCVFAISFRITGQPQSSYPPSTPFLRIETGMHTAMVRRIDVDAGERFLVSASEDKTARVWDLATGRLLRTLRPPQGDGSQGKLYAVAISPDGATVAVGGYTGPSGEQISLYLFDRLTGNLVHTISGFPEVINHLSYSRNGSYLVAALGRDNGIRVYRTSDYHEIARDTAYGSDSYWAEFDRAGRLVTVSDDGLVRLYSPEFRLLTKRQAPGGNDPMSARFSPDGARIAVGFFGATVVSVLSSADLSLLYAPDTTQFTGGDLSTIAWSQDGKTLYAGGSHADSSSRYPILSWKDGGRGSVSEQPKAGASIRDIRTLSGGRLAIGTADPTVGVMDAAGGIVWKHTPETLSFRGDRILRVSGDGNVVEFDGDVLGPELRWTRRDLRFSVINRRLAVDPSADSSLAGPRTDGLNITGLKDSHGSKLNGRALALDDYEQSRSLAISTRGDQFLLGTQWRLRLYDRRGKPIWAKASPGAVWAVNLTANGKYAVAAFGDGTVRWYLVANGQEVMGLFVHPDTQRWIAWAPEGFFDSSRGGETLIGYHVNRGPDREGEFIDVKQVTKLFFRPDLIAQVLKPGGLELIATERRRIGDIATVLSAGLPPELHLLSSSRVDSNGDYVLRLRVTDQGTGKGRVVYRIDGVEMEGRPVDIPEPGLDTVSRKFDLPPGQHQVSATVYDKSNKLESRSIGATVNVRAAQQAPALFVVAVGITNYRDHALNSGVRFAAQDAQELASRLKQQGPGLFRTVTTYLLPDEKATRGNIENTIKSIAGQIQANDEFIFYLAGHGTAVDGQYYFVPWEVRYTNVETLEEQSLGEQAIQNILKLIPAKKTLLVLDTCDAGAAISGRDTQTGEKGSIDRLSKITGRAILAASSSNQMALEGYQNHGVYTFAFLEGLSKAADDNGFIQVSRLADYLETRVPEITRQRWGYEQFPMRELAGQTFPIARRP